MVTQKGQHKQWGKCHQTKKESVLKEETVNKIARHTHGMLNSKKNKVQCKQKSTTQPKKQNANKKT